MTTLIERQQVRRRAHRAPLLLPPPETNERPTPRSNRTRVSVSESWRRLLPTVIFGVVALAVVGAALATFSNHPQVPRGGLALPKDPEVKSVLASYVDVAPPAPKIQAPAAQIGTIVPAPRIQTYTVRKGDTVAGIAQAFHVTDETIISYNKIEDVRRIIPGVTLKIPSANGVLYRVQRGDSLSGISKSYSVALPAILDANNLQSSTIYPGQDLFLPGAHMSAFEYRKALGTLFIFPTSGIITSGFGMRHDPFTGIVTFHNGIDIANIMGTPIRAAMDGRVAYIGENRGYGRFILIDHGGGFQTLYGHLYKWLVQRGQYVRMGEEIGLMGDTGYSTGPHLHFTIYKNSVPVNPLTYLSQK